jgi:hypothetical protein
MSWPLSQDYNEAIQSLATNFADPDLQSGSGESLAGQVDDCGQVTAHAPLGGERLDLVGNCRRRQGEC